jgi:8-oxo-dGTP pyrophosphatase MutT (NUDIX family)
MTTTSAPARPSASVVIARDGVDGLEILLVQRNEKVVFHGGAWVFPGGRVDDQDSVGVTGDELETAKRAAARETFEEAGLTLTASDMRPFAHWTTPVQLPKRFATWFFVALVEGQPEVRIDNSEIVDYRWMTPATALNLHGTGKLTLPGPTFVSLLNFKPLATTAKLLAHVRDIEVQRFVPRLVELDGGRCALYHEDAGYETLDMDAPGARHRLVMRGANCDYIRDY